MNNKTLFCIFFSRKIKILAGCYQKNKEMLSKRALERYQNLSQQEKKKRQYARELYQILAEDKNSVNLITKDIKIF